ncbi:hypothetical protein D3C79_751920 [compost metagenome]
MNGGVDRTQLDHLGAGGSDEAPVGGAARGEQGRLLAVDGFDGPHGRRQQLAGVGQEGLAGEGPLDLKIQPVTGQQGLDLFADRHIGELGAETEVELHVQLAGDHVGGTGAGLDVRYLEAGGGEVGVTLIPDGAGQLAQGGGRTVDGVVRQMGVGHVTLHSAHQQIPGDGAAPAILHHVTHQGGGGGLADDAPADLLVSRLQRLYHPDGTVDEGALFIGGDEEGNGA